MSTFASVLFELSDQIVSHNLPSHHQDVDIFFKNRNIYPHPEKQCLHAPCPPMKRKSNDEVHTTSRKTRRKTTSRKGTSEVSDSRSPKGSRERGLQTPPSSQETVQTQAASPTHPTRSNRYVAGRLSPLHTPPSSPPLDAQKDIHEIENWYEDFDFSQFLSVDNGNAEENKGGDQEAMSGYWNPLGYLNDDLNESLEMENSKDDAGILDSDCRDNFSLGEEPSAIHNDSPMDEETSYSLDEDAMVLNGLFGDTSAMPSSSRLPSPTTIQAFSPPNSTFQFSESAGRDSSPQNSTAYPSFSLTYDTHSPSQSQATTLPSDTTAGQDTPLIPERIHAHRTIPHPQYLIQWSNLPSPSSWSWASQHHITHLAPLLVASYLSFLPSNQQNPDNTHDTDNNDYTSNNDNTNSNNKKENNEKDKNTEGENEVLYIPDRILGKKKVKNVWCYLVKWEGFEREEDRTWEPCWRLKVDVPLLVEEFEDGKGKGKGKRKGKR